jgi:hypothetical protein
MDRALLASTARLGSGQPRYSQLAIATALILQTVFRLGLRQTEGLVGSVMVSLVLISQFLIIPL